MSAKEPGVTEECGAEPWMVGMLDCGSGGMAGPAPLLMAHPHGTYVVCMSSGLGTHCRRCERSWKALLWGSSIRRP